MKKYRIADEPTPGNLARVATNPLWPFIAVMLGGVWLSWSWFAINSFAVGSPTKRKELVWISIGLLVSTVLVLVIVFIAGRGIISQDHVKYALLIITVWKLGVTYVLFLLQNRTIEIYEFYGGVLTNGIFFLLIAVFFLNPLIKPNLPTLLIPVLI